MDDKNSERKKRDKNELQKASDHLHYEIKMFKALADELEKYKKAEKQNEDPVRDALHESFLIHVRGLLDFFYVRCLNCSKKDDVIAEDFFPDLNVWLEVKPPQSELLQTTRKKINKEIAHLTYARLKVTSDRKLWWSFRKIAEEINTIINTFLNHVPKEFLGKKWNNRGLTINGTESNAKSSHP